MDDSATGDSVPVHATISEMYEESFQPIPYDVLMRDRGDDDTVTLFTGTRDDCYVYVQGWMDCLIQQTAYYLHPEQHDDYIVFYSPLVSESNLEVWIMPSVSNEEEDKVPIKQLV